MQKTLTLRADFQAGLAFHQQGKFAEARAIYEAILDSRPADFDALHLLGVLSLQTGDTQRGIDLIARALSVNPAVAAAYNNLGNAYQALGKFDAALANYAKAIELQPDYPEAYNNRGNALKELNDLDGAVHQYNKAVALKPDYAEAYSNRGNVLQRLRRPTDALASYDQAIALRPEYAEAHNNRGNTLQDLKRFDDALASFNRAITLNPRYAEAYNNRGNTLQELKRFRSATADYDRATSLNPRYAEAYFNHGIALYELQELDTAVAKYESAIALNSNYAEAYYNHGVVLQELKRFDAAHFNFDRAIALDAAHAYARFNKGLLLLLQGQFAEGWKLYESRNSVPSLFGQRTFPQPLWLGDEDISRKSILVHGEQGLGDTIQFCRYITLLQKRAKKVLFAPQPPLRTLMQGLDPSISIVDPGDAGLVFDYHCPLLSLPLAFRTVEATIPGVTPYLQSDAARTAAWRERIGSSGFRVGIGWQGSTSRIDRGRSFPATEFRELSKIPGVRLISLQKGEGVDQLRTLPGDMSIEHFTDDLDASGGAFSDTAAIMQNCDLIITSDTAIAHLAGALGRPAWIALRYIPDWRWMLDRSDSPWYPSMRLFRQPARGDWKSVFLQMQRELEPLASRGRPQQPAALPLPGMPHVRVSWGELLDKLTILQIKLTRIADETSLSNVKKELALLSSAVGDDLNADTALAQLRKSLYSVNLDLWEIEDKIRAKEGCKAFDAEFIELARSVYKRNDRRAALKREINRLLASEIVEEKSHKAHQ